MAKATHKASAKHAEEKEPAKAKQETPTGMTEAEARDIVAQFAKGSVDESKLKQARTVLGMVKPL